jgi:hypothetical protein
LKIRIQTTIGIQSRRGVHFGTSDWIKGHTVQLRSPAPLQCGEAITLKIELPGTGDWVLAEAKVMRTAPSVRDETTRILARIHTITPAHRKRLQTFIKSATETPNTRHKTARPISLHEPTIALSTDGRNLTAKWSDPRAFRRDWALHLSRGRLPASGPPPHRRAFMMRILMPDGFVTTFPAEIGETLNNGWLVRFLVPHEAFTRMRSYAEQRQQQVV